MGGRDKTTPVTSTTRCLKRYFFKTACKNTHFSSLEWETEARTPSVAIVVL